MKKLLARRTISILLVVVMISCMSLTAFAAPSYDSDTQVLRLHNSETEFSASELRTFFNSLGTGVTIGATDVLQITGNTEPSEVWSSTNVGTNFSAVHGVTYDFKKRGLLSRTWTDVAVFTAEIYDNLTVTKNNSSANVTVNETQVTTDGTTVEVTRGESAELVVGGLEDYCVNVKLGTETLDTFGIGEGGTVTVSGLEADKNIIVEYVKDTDASISVSENAGSATVAVNDSKIYNGETKILTPGETVTVTATPSAGSYIDALEVYSNETKVSGEMTFSGNTASVAFTADENLSYEIKVLSKQAEIVLTGNTIGYNTSMTTQEIWDAIYELIDETNSVPGISADNVTIQYAANNVFGIKQWVDLDYEPQLVGHAFGENTEEDIKITYSPTDARYPTVNLEVTITLEAKPSDCIISVGENEGNATVMVNGQPAPMNVAEKTEVSVTASPANGFYIEDIEIWQNDNKVDCTVSWNGAVVTAAFTAGSNMTYTVNVKSAEAQIALMPGDRIISYNNFMDINDAKKAIFNMIDTGNSVPGITEDNVTIQYEAYASSILSSGWRDLDYQPQSSIAHAFGNETENIKITFDLDGDRYPKVSKEFTITLVDDREETVITLNEGKSIVYSEDITEEQIYNLVFKSLTDVNGNPIDAVFGEGGNMTVEYDALYAGTHTVTVKYSGDKTYADSSAQVEITVNKAISKINVQSQTVSYADRENIGSLISTNPEGVSCISFAAGLDISDGSSYIQLDLPALIDPDAVHSELIRNLLNSIYEGLETEVSVAELSDILQSALESLEVLQNDYNLPINLDPQTIQCLISTLESIEQLEGLTDLTVKITVDSSIIPENSGVYLIGAVTSDANYTTDIDLGYLVITPNASKVDLEFNVIDDNGFITRGSILSGEYDLGSHVVAPNLTDEQIAEADEKVVNLYMGITANGTAFVSNDPSAEIGVYTQISYIRDWGNDMYWAVPIVRPYSVVADTVSVNFIDEDGNVNNDRQFTYDGTPKSMTAVAKDRNQNVLNSSDISYLYIGTERDGERYYSSEAPTESGAYTVIATYKDFQITLVGVGIGVMVIKPADAEITVNDKNYVYDGSAVNVSEMIDKTPDAAEMIVITAGLTDKGDFSENGLLAVAGVMNLDLPERVDDILKNVIPFAYADGINLSSFISMLDDIKSRLIEAGMNASVLEQLTDILSQMPDNMIITFKDYTEVNPSKIGVYMVAALICNSNYTVAADTGVLVISPEITKAEIEWNYEDANGIVSLPVLRAADMSASAYVDGTKNDDLTSRIEYIFIGADEKGKPVFTDDVSELGNGVYTQIAFIREEVSASMTLTAPIMRTIVVAPQNVNVDISDFDVTYDGQQHSSTAIVTDASGEEITGDRLSNLTVTYLSADISNGFYNSTVAPENAGVYIVIAEYEERDSSGELVYYGASAGKAVIRPAEAEFEISDAEFMYDGTEKFNDIINPEGLDYISVVVDENNNVNIILPESWGIGSLNIDIAGGIQAIIEKLKALPGFIADSDIVARIEQVLSNININALSVDGDKPVKAGEYNVFTIAFGKNYNAVTQSGVLTILDYPSTVDVLIGDADGDGQISVMDATTIQEYLVDLTSLTGVPYIAADVNEDGVINVIDATLIQKYLVDLTEEGNKTGEIVKKPLPDETNPTEF